MDLKVKKEAPKDLVFGLIFSHYFGCGLDIFRSCHKFGRLQKFDPDIGPAYCNRDRLPSSGLGIFRCCRSSGRLNFVFPDSVRCCHKNVRLQKLGLDIFRFYRTFFRNHPFGPCIFRFRRNIFQRRWRMFREQKGKTAKQ